MFGSVQHTPSCFCQRGVAIAILVPDGGRMERGRDQAAQVASRERAR